jgi:galactoside O-acetyltransferase
MSNFYNDEELKKINFKSYGINVLVSKKVSIYGAEKISIGNNVRIDDFCILSGNIKIGNYVHISAYCALYGKFGIEIGDFCGCSPRTTLFSASDDFSGEFMIGPMVSEEYTNVKGGPIKLENYVQIGASSVVMPNITLKEGSAAGTFSFINKDLDEWSIYVGIPSKKIKNREKKAKELSQMIKGDD